MSLLGDWVRSRKLRYQAAALKEAAEIKRHERRLELSAKPFKSGSELVEAVLLESTVYGWDQWVGPWREGIDAMLDFSRGGWGWGGTGVTDHTSKRGADFPFYKSEGELATIRDASRVLVTTDPNAWGLLGGLQSYTIGDGATVRVSPRGDSPEAKQAAAEAQAYIDEFDRRNKMGFRVPEFFWRSRRDGGAYLRMFDGRDGYPNIRFVWPEQIRKPAGEPDEEWEYGIHTDPDDAEDIISYAVFPISAGSNLDWDDVPAQEMVSLEINVDSGVRRGVPDFSFGTEDTLSAAAKLAKNMGIGSAIQAAIAYIRQHDGAPAESIRAFADSDAHYKRQNPIDNHDDRIRHAMAGTVLDTNKNTMFVPSPYNAGVSGHMDVGQMLLRRACVRWNAPEWLGSADASNNNYASSLSAESPFVIKTKFVQRIYSDTTESVYGRVLAYGAAVGKLRQNVLAIVDVKVTFPSPEARNKLEEAQRGATEIQSGTSSPQLEAEAAGRDWSRVKRDREELGMGFGETPQKLGEMNVTRGKVQGGMMESLLEALLEGFTGTKKDSLNREYHYVDGKRVASAEDVAKAGGNTHKATSGILADSFNRKVDAEHKKAINGEEADTSEHARVTKQRIANTAVKAWAETKEAILQEHGDTPVIRSLIQSRLDSVREKLDAVKEAIDVRASQPDEQQSKEDREFARADVHAAIERLHNEIERTKEVVSQSANAANRNHEFQQTARVAAKLEANPSADKVEKLLKSVQGDGRFTSLRQDPDSGKWEIHTTEMDSRGGHFRLTEDGGLQLVDSQTKKPTTPGNLQPEKSDDLRAE